MNTHGHHRIADEAGLPRLRQAFADLGIDDINLTAFYLGNWLTDLSQVRVPDFSGEARDVGGWLKDKVGLIVAELHAFIEEHVCERHVPAEFAGVAQPWIEQARCTLREAATAAVTEFVVAFEALLGAFSELARGDALNELLKSAVKFAAYSKFAHPDPLQKKPGLDFRIFTRLGKLAMEEAR